MAICSECGKEAIHSVTTFAADGSVKAEKCRACAGASPLHSMTDRKLWTGEQVAPHRYKKREKPDGSVVFEASDEEHADNVAALLDPLPEDLAPKRRVGRTAPLTEQEIAEIKLMFARAEAEVRAAEAGLLLPQEG